MIKLVGIDLDGTLFDSEKKISAENKKAIAQARNLGCKIVIATGRPLKGVLEVLEELNLNTDNDFVIVYNGGKILNSGTSELIFSSTINGKQVKNVYNEALRLNSYMHAFRKSEEFVNYKSNIYSDVEIRINHLSDKIIDFMEISDEEEFIKAMIVDDEKKLDEIEKLVSKDLRDTMTIVRSSKIFLEFLNPKVEKGLAILNLAKYLGIKPEETMAIGDAGNDLSMIKEAFIGVAMKNGSEICKTNANYITTADNNNSGVAEAINKFVINV